VQAESEVAPGCTRLKTALLRHQQFKCARLMFEKERGMEKFVPDC
jgi:hypothetical protein